jgi:hypothetical protein
MFPVPADDSPRPTDSCRPPRPDPRISPAAELARRANPAVIALRVCMVLNALWLVGSVLSFALFAATGAIGDGGDMLINITDSASSLAILSILVTAVFFLRWLYLARKNLEGVATQRLRNSPGWLMASWFIPLANAWFPYEATYEVWRLSGVFAELAPVEAAHGEGWWWVSWLAYLGALSFAMKPDAFVSVPVAGALGVVSAWLATRMVNRLTERQQRMFAHQQ